MPDGHHLGANNAGQAREFFSLSRGAASQGLKLPWIWSAHSPAEAARMISQGASAITISPIYETASHPEQAGVGLEILRQAVAQCPEGTVLALGGIGPGRVAPCREAGASGVAMIGAVFSGEGTLRKRVQMVLQEWSQALGSEGDAGLPNNSSGREIK